MAEWVYEAGIGENRAALIEDDTIVEAIIELPGQRVGDVVAAKILSAVAPSGAIVRLGGGGEALLDPLPRGLSIGSDLLVEIVRAAIPEARRPKLPRCNVAEGPERRGPDLKQRIAAERFDVVVTSPATGDRLEQAGWSAVIAEAAMGEVAFDGGNLRMSLTPAMTLFDVDGPLPPAELARAGADAAARAIQRLGISGSIGIDLPTLSSRDERQAVAAAVDAILPQPFERTAVNGFGFLQIVRRRTRVSLPELVQSDPTAAAARDLLRRASWSAGHGERLLTAHPRVIARIEAEAEWLAELQRRIGVRVVLRADPALAIWAGHVHAAIQT